MARKAKRKKKAAKAKKRGAKRAKKGAKRRVAKAKAKTQRTGSSSSATRKAARRQKEPIPAEPAGRIGLQRPSNLPKPPGQNEPRELAQAEPDARFGDRRQPEENARDPEEAAERSPDERRYKNTDEPI